MKIKSLLGDRSFYRRFLQISFPVMIQQGLATIVTFIDTFMVSHLTNEAVSGVFAANQLSFLFIVAIFGLLGGCGIYMQQFHGAQDVPHLQQTFGFKISLFIGLLTLAIPALLLFGKQMIHLYTMNDAQVEVIDRYAWDYFSILLFSFIPYGFSQVIATSFREIGKSKFPLYAAFFALFCNACLNPLFIYGFQLFGVQCLPALGVKGAAIATVIARTLEFIMLLFLLLKVRPPFFSSIRRLFHFDKRLLSKITTKSIPLFVNEIIWSLSMTLMTLAYAQRDGVLSSLSVVSTVSELFQILFQGLSVGIGVMVGHALGANRLSEAKESARKLMALGVIAALVLSLLLAAFSGILPYAFQEVTQEQKHVASQLILCYSFFVVPFAFNCAIYVLLKCGGRTWITFCMDSLFTLCVQLVTAWCLSLATDWPLLAIYAIVESLALIKSVIAFWLYKKEVWIRDLAQGFQNV